MELMAKIAAAAITAAVLGAILRKPAPEMALLLTLAAGIWIVWSVLDSLLAVRQALGQLQMLAQLPEELLRPVVKTVAISLVTKLTGEICRSAGEQGVAAFVELAGTVSALLVCLPLLQAVSTLLMEMLQ